MDKTNLDKSTQTGLMGLCDECKELMETHIAMVVIEQPTPAEMLDNGNVDPAKARRAGKIHWVHKEAFGKLLNGPDPDKGICFIEAEVGEFLAKAEAQINAGSADGE
jgi:hypothetical protein